MNRAAITFSAFLLLLAGCDGRGNPDVCGTLERRGPFVAPRNWLDQRKATIGCVDHWSARLSLGPDNAETIANAVVGGACGDAIEQEQKWWKKEQGAAPVDPSPKDYWRDMALFRVTQWRAGRCPVN